MTALNQPPIRPELLLLGLDGEYDKYPDPKKRYYWDHALQRFLIVEYDSGEFITRCINSDGKLSTRLTASFDVALDLLTKYLEHHRGTT